MIARVQILKKPSLIYLCTVGLIFTSCQKEEVDIFDCSGLNPTYTVDIKPILDASCAKSGCHNAATAKRGVNLSTFESASSESQKDQFLGVIQHKKGYPKMPDDGPQLPASQVELLTCWVQNGSPE